MKKILALLVAFTLPLHALPEDEVTLDNRPGVGSADAITTAISISMIGWGIGITAAIALLTILVPPDNETSAHTHSGS